MLLKIFLCLLPTILTKECYWNSKDPYRYFGSKTPYDEVRGDIRDIQDVKGCEAVTVWAMFRHGNRHPGEDDIIYMKQAAALKDMIIDNYSEGLGKMCAQDISDLKSWVWDEEIDDTPSYLTSIGYQEHAALGTRFHEKFHGLLETLDWYLFRPSTEQRTRESAKAFVEGLGQNKFSFNISEPMDADEVVRPYKLCEKYETEVKDSPAKKNNVKDYYETMEFDQVKNNVISRLGLNIPLISDNITGLYELCRYYRSYSIVKRNPWCAAFSNQDLEVLDYADDVRHYYRNGYGGASVTANLGGLVLKDLFLKFESAKNESTRSFTGYFSHDTMLDMVYSALDLFKDYPEIAGFYRDQERKWKTSLMVPFAANIVAVLYRCQTEDQGHTYKVKLLVNEVEIPLCKGWMCTWQEFENKFQKFSNLDMKFCVV